MFDGELLGEVWVRHAVTSFVGWVTAGWINSTDGSGGASTPELELAPTSQVMPGPG